MIPNASDTDTAIRNVATAVGDAFAILGLKSVSGRIWATLFLHQDALDAPEIRRLLGISMGAASMGLNDLLETGLIHRDSAPGERRFFYRAESDLWQVSRRLFRHRLRPALEHPLEQIRSAELHLRTLPLPSAPLLFSLERIRNLLEIGAFSLDLLDAFSERTRVELKAARKWLSVSGRIGGEPFSRIRRRLNRTD